MEENYQENTSEEIDISSLSKEAYRLIKEAKLAQAKSNFEKILSIEPINNFALVGLGDCARKERDFDLAITYYKKCLAYYPSNNYALFGLADSYRVLQQHSLAIEAWERYYKLDEKNITVITRIADTYRKIKNFERSQELYGKVLDLDPANIYALNGLGHLNYNFHKFEEALKYWLKIYSMHGPKSDIRVLTAIGNCYRKLKYFKDALSFFNEAISRQDNNYYALFGLADSYRGLEDYQQSLSYLEKIIENYPSTKFVYARIGDIYYKLNKSDEALTYYNKSLDISYDVYSILGKAKILWEQDNRIDAISILEQIVNVSGNYRVYLLLAKFYREADELEKAIELLGQYMENGVRRSSISEEYENLVKLQEYGKL